MATKTKRELEREVAELRRLALEMIQSGRDAEAETRTRSTADGRCPYAYGMLEGAVRRLALMLDQPFPSFSVGGAVKTVTKTCEHCLGAKRVWSKITEGYEPCPDCNGAGTVGKAA